MKTGKKRGRPAKTEATLPVVEVPTVTTGKKRGRPAGSTTITKVMNSKPAARKVTGAAAHKQFNDADMIQFATWMMTNHTPLNGESVSLTHLNYWKLIKG